MREHRLEQERDQYKTALANWGEVALKEQARVLALVKAVENIAAIDCQWRRDYLDGGDCKDNGVLLGCPTCQARAAIADWEGGPR